jgi:hypothetical protein
VNIRALFSSATGGDKPWGTAINAYDNRTCRIAGKLSRNNTPAATKYQHTFADVTNYLLRMHRLQLSCFLL